MKMLLLGKDGQLGRELQRSLAPLGHLTAWGRSECDLSQTEALYAKVTSEKPDIIVNAAAYTAVDKAESEAELAHLINARAPALLAQAARDMGCKLVHFSTDYVFNGTGIKPWTEEAKTAPLNVYGKSKLAGEQAVMQNGCKHLIFRTSWVYASHGQNFAKTMLRLASERDVLSVIDDQIGAPTSATWLANITAQAMTTRSLGIYHAVAAGEVSWHDYASYLIATARNMGFPLKAHPENIQRIPSDAFPTIAKRPRNSRLDCSKLRQTFNIQPPPWQQGIDQLLLSVCT